MLITRAPFATAQRIAFASASTGIERCGPDDLRDQQLAPAARARRSRRRRSSRAAIRPATNVPCPCVSTVGGPGDEALRGRDPRRAARDASPSTPESITATRTGARGGGSAHASKDAVLRGIPLPRQERVVGHVRDAPRRRAARRTAFPRTPRRADARWRRDRERADRREVDDPRRATGARAARRRAGCVGGRRDARPRSAPRHGRRRGEAERNGREEGRPPSRSLRRSRRDGDRQRGARLALGREPVGRRWPSGAR